MGDGPEGWSNGVLECWISAKTDLLEYFWREKPCRKSCYRHRRSQGDRQTRSAHAGQSRRQSSASPTPTPSACTRRSARSKLRLTEDAIAVPIDVRDEKDVRHMAYTVADRFGQIDALINDAGIVPHFNWGIPRWPRVRYLSKDFWDSVIQTNLGGTFLCTKYVVPFMEEQRSGNIVNLWGGGRAENHGASPYVVSKDAIRTFTRFVAEEEREWNVCVVAFSPKQAIATEDAPAEARQRLPGPGNPRQWFCFRRASGNGDYRQNG